MLASGGQLSRADFDAKHEHFLQDLPLEVGEAALQEFAGHHKLASLRSKGSYFMGILRRHASGEPAPPPSSVGGHGHGGNGGNGGNGGHGGAQAGGGGKGKGKGKGAGKGKGKGGGKGKGKGRGGGGAKGKGKGRGGFGGNRGGGDMGDWKAEAAVEMRQQVRKA